MATTKTTPEKLTPTKMKAKIEKLEYEVERLKKCGMCIICDRLRPRDLFYVCSDKMVGSGYAPVCKDCAKKIAHRVDENGDEHEPTKDSVQLALKYLNKPYLESVWDASVQESENLTAGRTKTSVWTSYIKNISMINYLGMTYFDSDFYKNKIEYEDEIIKRKNEKVTANEDIHADYLKNKEDVKRLLGYDPFEGEAISDQPMMYSQCLGFLDTGGDENDDMMRNASIIAIVRGFAQQSKIDDTIARLMGTTGSIDKNSGTIKSLQDSKQKIIGVITNLAAENCISLKNNKNAKKGENTWTGKIKKIQDLDLREGRVNGFEIDTAKAMRQVADISHKSIIQELRFDESDWSDIVAEQRELVVQLQRELDRYMEYTRILLSENLDLKDYMRDKGIEFFDFDAVDLEDLFSKHAATGEDDE